MRDLEPIVKIAEETILLIEIWRDEQRIIGYLTKIPEEGESMTFGYGERPKVQMKGLSKITK